MTRLVKLVDVWVMLDQCLPGYTRKASTEYWTIGVAGRVPYRGLPVGKHGKKTNASIEAGHVRSLVRYFGIVDCAANILSIGL